MPQAQPICDTCRTIPFLAVFTKRIKHKDAIALGPLEDILRKKERCYCCAVIARSFQAQQPWARLDAVRTRDLLLAEGDATDVWLYNYTFIDKNELPLRIGISTNRGNQINRRGRRKHAGDLHITQASAEKMGLSPQGQGRELAQAADISLARTWLKECLKDHRELCNQPGYKMGQNAAAEPPTRLRVIDVHRRCLAALPDGDQYIALSYCWSKQPGLINNTANCLKLSEPGAICTANGLHETIDEACNAVQDLGERYIWVDALCIVQNDSRDKAHQIGQMDLVYGSALLTIVSAPDKSDINQSGLPGYRATSQSREQSIRTIGGIDLAVPKPCLEDVLSYTKWDTRGWTFQEAHLSRRSLFFTSQQLYFQCSCGIRCEDTAGEGLAYTTSIKHSTTLWNPKNRHAADAEINWGDLFLSRAPYEADTEALSAHDTFVAAYLRRELSFASDILNAFEGIAKVLAKAMGTPFYAGLPVRWLDHALLWQPNDAAVRRQGFPSFSWAGWQGGAEAPYWLHAGSTRKLVKWWRVEAGMWIECITDTFESVGKKDALVERRHMEFDGVHLTSAWALATVTEVASFSLSLDVAEVEDAEMWSHAQHRFILDCWGKRAGLILVDNTWAVENISTTRLHNFILLSEAKRCRNDNMTPFDETVYEQRDWCLFNIMLVIRHEHKVAGRFAVGTIHCDAWHDTKPTVTDIYLG